MTRITRPQAHEPIRLVETNRGPRYRVGLTTGQYPDGKRRQETTTHPSLTDARKHVERTRSALQSGTYTAKDRTTVDAVCTLWLASKREVRPVTVNAYASALKSVRARLGAMSVQDVRRSHVEAFVTWLHTEGGQRGTGVSHRTTSLTLGTLRMVFSYAVAEGIITASPVDD